MLYRYTDTRPTNLADGRFVGYGSEVELSKEEAKLADNERLIDSKALQPVERERKTNTTKRGDR